MSLYQPLFLSGALLVLFILALRWRGHGRWLAWLALTSIFTFTLLSGLHLGLSVITGEGVNNAVFYHMATGLEGGDVSQYLPVLMVVCLSIGAVAAILWRFRRVLRGNAREGRWTWDLAIGALAIVSLTVHPVVTASASHFVRLPAAPHHAEGFAYPPPELVAPDKPRNLVIIYLESFERTYVDPARFPGLTPRLGALEGRALSFTGLGQTVGADFTIGGMVASQCGTPLILSGGVNSGKMSQFLSGATCLGDLLSGAGYRLSFLGGASTEFAGKGAFYRSHGYGEVSGLDELRPELAEPDYRAEWGLQDDTLLDLARARFDSLSGLDQPFVLTLLTLDTHHPNGHADTNRACAYRPYLDGSNPMLNAVFCNDFLAGQFIEEILGGPHGPETVIAVMSDHLAMVNSATDLLAAGPRRNLLMILDGNKTEARRVDRAATTLDTGPTLLSYMGFDVPRLGFGVDLMRDTETLPERLDVSADDRKALDTHLMGYEAVHDRLWAFPSIASGAYVNLERMEIQFGHDAYALPALFSIDQDLAISSLTMGDPTADETLTEAAAAFPDAVRYLWFDDCAALTLGIAGQDAARESPLCVAGGERRGSFAVRPIERSGFLSVEDLSALWPDGIETATEPAALEAIGTARGDLATHIGLRGLATGDRGVLLQLSDFGAGASLVRRQTVGDLTSGEDWLLQRGISLVGLAADGRAEILDRLDHCDPAYDAESHGFWKDRIGAPGQYVAHLVLVHDTAFCGGSFEEMAAPLSGLYLPVLRDLPFRKAYAAVIDSDGRAVELVNQAFSRIRLYLNPDGPTVGRSAMIMSTASVLDDAVPLASAEEETADPERANQAAGGPAVQTTGCLAPSPSRPTTADNALPLGARIGEASLSDHVGFGDGWWDAEPFGRWMCRKSASLSLVLPETTSPISLSLELSTYRAAPFTVRALHSGRLLTEFEVAGDHVAKVDLSDVPRGKPVDLVLELIGPDLTCPAVHGLGGDTRLLGLMLKGLTATPSSPPDEPLDATAAWPPISEAVRPAEGCTLPERAFSAVPGLSALPMGEPVTVPSAVASGMLAFGPGWWADEEFGRWMAGGAASFALTLPQGPAGPSLTLTGAAFGSEASLATVRHDGRELARGLIGDRSPLVADLSGLPRDRPVVLTLALEGFSPTCPAALDGSADTRTLGLMLHSIALSDAVEPRFPPVVAHGGGRLEGAAITNSLDAMDANASRYDLIEIDLNWTTDGELVCLHDWDQSFASRFEAPATPVDLATFRDLVARTPDQPVNCDLDTLVQWLRANPGPRIVTDIKANALKGHALIAERHPELIPRFLPQAYQPDEISRLRALGYREVIWTLYQFGNDTAAILRAARSERPAAIAMPVELAQSGLLSALTQELDLPLYVHTVNDRTEAACLLARGASGVYSDDLDVSDLVAVPDVASCTEQDLPQR